MTGTRLRALGAAAIVTLTLFVATRQLGCENYASSGAYRAQTDALLHGRLALTTAPEGLAHDLAWTDTGVQQVWGLGGPLWQAPFEAAARVVGQDPFPDRIALLVFLALAMFVVIRAFAPRDDEPWWSGAGSVLIVALLPAFVTMVRGRIGIYELAACYAYGSELVLLGGLILVGRAPTRTRYLGLLVLAGLTGLVRPTVWFYGLATAILATAIYLRAHGRRVLPSVALGAALFTAGGGALYATNAARFGRGTEFGHRLNVHSLPGNIVATRFSYPFERAGLGEATLELAGSLFGRPEAARARGFYERRLHVGQSERVRWREYYFTTYTWPYLPALLAGCVLGVLAWRRRREATADPLAPWLLAWAVISAGPLLVFYLHSPSVSSRYHLDLGPAFAALLVIGWRACVRWAAPRPRGVLAFAALLLAWGLSVGTSIARGRVAIDPTDRDGAIEATRKLTAPTTYPRTLPPAYDLADPKLRTWINPSGGAAPNQAPPLYINGSGWDLYHGSVPPATHLFVSDPAYLELEVETVTGVQVDWAANVRVAIGLAHPPLVATTPTPRGAILRFQLAAPLRGLHVVFLAFGPDTELDRERSSFVLKRLRWRDS